MPSGHVRAHVSKLHGEWACRCTLKHLHDETSEHVDALLNFSRLHAGRAVSILCVCVFLFFITSYRVPKRRGSCTSFILGKQCASHVCLPNRNPLFEKRTWKWGLGGRCWLWLTKTHVKVAMCMNTWNVPTVTTGILPQIVSPKPKIAVKCVAKVWNFSPKYRFHFKDHIQEFGSFVSTNLVIFPSRMDYEAPRVSGSKKMHLQATAEWAVSFITTVFFITLYVVFLLICVDILSTGRPNPALFRGGPDQNQWSLCIVEQNTEGDPDQTSIWITGI